MHRSQILLEEWQYEMLKTLSEREGRSVSEIVRELVTRFLGAPRPPAAKRGIGSIAGIANEPGVSGRDHDDAVYAPRHRRR